MIGHEVTSIIWAISKLVTLLESVYYIGDIVKMPHLDGHNISLFFTTKVL